MDDHRSRAWSRCSHHWQLFHGEFRDAQRGGETVFFFIFLVGWCWVVELEHRHQMCGFWVFASYCCVALLCCSVFLNSFFFRIKSLHCVNGLFWQTRSTTASDPLRHRWWLIPLSLPSIWCMNTCSQHTWRCRRVWLPPRKKNWRVRLQQMWNCMNLWIFVKERPKTSWSG